MPSLDRGKRGAPALICGLIMAFIGTLTTIAHSETDATARNLFAYDSEPGDCVGGGQRRQYTPQNANFTVHGSARDLQVSVETAAGYWYVELAAPRGETLVPRTYAQAERATVRTGRAPGLDVHGQCGCNELWGSFTLNQIGTDDAGHIIVLDATFSQRCESAEAPSLNGIILFQASQLSFAFESDPGDYLGQGESKTYTNATSMFRLKPLGSDVEYDVSGEHNEWTAFIGPPLGQTLQPGTYQTARSADATKARLDIYTDGRGCNQDSGTLTVADVVVDELGNIKRLSATFEQHCENREPALRGTIHHHD